MPSIHSENDAFEAFTPCIKSPPCICAEMLAEGDGEEPRLGEVIAFEGRGRTNVVYHFWNTHTADR